METRYLNIYVLSPANYVTGGVELTHQVVDYLNNRGANAYIVYVNAGEVVESEVTKEYANYHIKTTTQIIDAEENLLIMPEIYYEWIHRFKQISLGFWWMSVDNYVLMAGRKDKIRFEKCWWKRTKMRFKKRYRGGNIDLEQCKKEQHRGIHLYQSTYAQNYLHSNGIYNTLPLSDYINPQLVLQNEGKKREEVVLYNPAKGMEFTKEVMKWMPQQRFVPLEKLTREELSKWLSKAKLYIDFGHHPGKDRLPREAALNGCCVMTGVKGSAKFYEDVAIPDFYKVNQEVVGAQGVAKRIELIMKQYDERVHHFDRYRERIRGEQEQFYREIEALCFQQRKE